MQKVRASLILLVFSTLIFGSFIHAKCVSKCQCYHNSEMISCKNLNEFPPVPVVGNFKWMVILNSNLRDFSNLDKWETLEKINLVRTTYLCDLLNELENREIEFEVDFDLCSLQLETSTLGFHVDNFPINNQNISTNDTDFFFSISSSDEKENNSSKMEIIIGGCFAFLLLLIPIIVGVAYLVNKKVKILRPPPNLPTGSQLYLPSPTDSIELDSFDSCDFQASNENIYEIPNPIYSNV